MSLESRRTGALFKTKQGTTYFLTFIDDYLRYGRVYLLSHHYEALDMSKRYIIEIENQMEGRIKTLRTNHGHEYLSNMFKEYCEENDIHRQHTIPHTSQQNGVVERRGRTLLPVVRSMI